MNVNWRVVPGHEYLEVNTLGEVRRFGKDRLLRPHVYRNHYPRVAARRVNGCDRWLYVHDLVMAAFVGPKPAGAEVNHLDGIKTNNALGNLEYTTHAGNGRHAWRIGLQPRTKRYHGSKHHNAKLSEEKVVLLRAWRASGVPVVDIAETLGVTIQTIYRALNRSCWHHVS